LEDIVQKGAPPKETTISQSGWLNSIIFAASDAYATVRLEPQHRNQAPAVSIYPAWPYGLGTVIPTAVGWLPKFFRPDPARTFGSYVIMVGPESAALPFVSPSKLEIFLGDSSTEQSAFISVLAAGVELSDPTAFIDSLAKLPMWKSSGQDLVKIMSELTVLVEALKH
jgi:hypothetical protein